MPITNNRYVAPTWVDNAPPAISAAEMQALSDSAVVLHGTGAPTTATAGLVGQFYIDDANNKLYICKSVSGGAHLWQANFDSANLPTASAIGAVPITRKVNNQPLSSDITLTASEVGAVKSLVVNGMPTPNSWRRVCKMAAITGTSITVRISTAYSSSRDLGATLGIVTVYQNYAQIIAESISNNYTGAFTQARVVLDSADNCKYVELYCGSGALSEAEIEIIGLMARDGITAEQLTPTTATSTAIASVTLANGKSGLALTSGDINTTVVPTTRTVNGKALSANIALTAADVKAGVNAGYAAADLNTLVDSGFYRVGGQANIPSGCSAGNLIVSRGGDALAQIIGSKSTADIYYRGAVSSGGVWNFQPWAKLLTPSNFSLSGTTLTITV